MTCDKLILNRLFTQNVFLKLLYHSNNTIYATIVQRYVNDPETKNNGALISEIYKYMSKAYRNEYFYQNTLLNKLLLGKHSVNTTTALTQIPIGKSKADFILINGKAVVYEIKTELDSLDRLATQLNDYYKAFNHVCVVTSESHYERVWNTLKNSSVGIYVLTRDNKFSKTLRKEPTENNCKLDYTVIFKVLHKQEYENILMNYFGKLPNVSQVYYYDECLNLFSQIPILVAYTMALKELKKRNRIQVSQIKRVPYELKSLFYFSKSFQSNIEALNNFLNKEYGG